MAEENRKVVLSPYAIEVLTDALAESRAELERLGKRPCSESAIIWYEEWMRKCALERDLKGVA